MGPVQERREAKPLYKMQPVTSARTPPTGAIIQIIMEDRMDPQFENQYTVSKKSFFEWTKRPVTTDVTTYLWIAIAIIIVAFAIVSMAYKDIFYLSFYVFFELFCIYRIFFRKKLLLSKQFKAIAVVQGKEEWNRRIEFGDRIRVIDGNTISEYEWTQVKEFILDRNYFILVMAKRLGLRIDKAGFTKGTNESFTEYMKKEHGDISVKIRK